jgi:hypothetical protein
MLRARFHQHRAARCEVRRTVLAAAADAAAADQRPLSSAPTQKIDQMFDFQFFIGCSPSL